MILIVVYDLFVKEIIKTKNLNNKYCIITIFRVIGVIAVIMYLILWGKSNELRIK